MHCKERRKKYCRGENISDIFFAQLRCIEALRYSISLLLAVAPGPIIFATDIVFLTCIYASLQPHKLSFKIPLLNLIWLLVLYVLFFPKNRWLIQCII